MMRRAAGMLTVLLLAAGTAVGQDASTTRGFLLGIQFQADILDTRHGPADAGAGIGFDVGYGFRGGLTLFLHGSLSEMTAAKAGDDDYFLGYGELGASYSFRTSAARWRPFVEAYLGAISTEYVDIEYLDCRCYLVSYETYSGPLMTVGGGAEYFFNPRWAMNFGVRLTRGSIDEIETSEGIRYLSNDEIVHVNTLRLRWGIRYHFAGRAQTYTQARTGGRS